ncbi:MAG: hypothetical protein HYW80_00300 [Parcubacteria group bacterium]|nr:hypothetical protein [Parcubacteria group bacterium]
MALLTFNKISTQADCSSKGAGFTLFELLIIVGIIVIGAAAVLLILNPVEYLNRARDSIRINDLQNLRSALDIAEFENKNLGAPNTVYISLPDTSSACGNLGLQTLPSGWVYRCVTAGNLRNVDGSGWVPVNFAALSIKSPFAALPIDPLNSTSTLNYYTYVTGGSYELNALLDAQKNLELEGVTSGNLSGSKLRAVFSLGSHHNLTPPFRANMVKYKNFWVMRYEAKYDKNGDGKGDEALDAGCVANWNDGLDWRDPGCGDGNKIVSAAEGSPVVHITHTQAKAACEALNMHLILNDEWTAIVRDAEQQAVNWSGGAVGSGCLFRGNTGWVPDPCGYNGDPDPERGATRNARSKLVLGNKEEIWDLAGNVLEHVMRDDADTLTPEIDHPDTALGGGTFLTRNLNELTDLGSFSYSAIRPSDSSWGSSQGMGGIVTCDQCTGSTAHVLLRGGHWADAAFAGGFSLDLSRMPDFQYERLGFRCAR